MNQRGAALPSARSGIYVARAAELGIVRIGVSADAWSRALALTRQIGVAVEVLFSEPMLRIDAVELETAIKQRFSRVHLKGEWFAVSAETMIAAVKRGIQWIRSQSNATRGFASIQRIAEQQIEAEAAEERAMRRAAR